MCEKEKRSLFPLQKCFLCAGVQIPPCGWGDGGNSALPFIAVAGALGRPPFLERRHNSPPPTKVFCTKPNPGCRCCTTPAWWWCCLDRPYPGTVLGLLSTGLKLSASSLMPPPEAADTPTPRPTTAYNLLGTLAGRKPCSDLATPNTLLPQSLATNQGIGCHRHV